VTWLAGAGSRELLEAMENQRGSQPMSAQRLNNLFSSLYKWLHGQDENFVTEAFGFILGRLLETDKALGNTLVRWLCFPADSPISLDGQVWEVTLQETGTDGRPDIWLRSGKALVLIEVKKRSGLGKKQLERYRKILHQSGAETQQLVLLTESPVEIGVNAEKPDYEVRWHRVAEWLRGHPSVDPMASFLITQFTDFLEEQRMAVQQVGKEYLVGIEAFLRLITMLEKAIQDCGLNCTTSAGQKRFGFYLEKPMHNAFLVYINFKEPTFLRFRFAEVPCNEEELIAKGGKIVDRKKFFELNLTGQNPDFFTLPADDQITVITEFLKSSFKKAMSCIKQSSV
jgi:hypothetical protein